MKTTQYQPKTGQPCGCKPGQQRDNCPQCEGTGQRIDFAAIRARNAELPPLMRATHCFAIPGRDGIIDMQHPDTGLSCHCNDTLAQIQVRYPGAELVEYAEHARQQAERQDAPGTWDAITEERYFDYLECVPPAAMAGRAFLVGEPCDHHARTGQPRFQACRSRGSVCEAYSRPMTRAEFHAMLAERSAHSATLATMLA